MAGALYRYISFAVVSILAGNVFSCSENSNGNISNDLASGVGENKDAGADTDSDIDCDPDKKCGGGITECSNNRDCSKIACECICPRLLGDQEVTSYCYGSCDKENQCEKGFNCIVHDEASPDGVCLETNYFKAEWKGYYRTYDMPPARPENINAEFNVGTISINFEWVGIYEEIGNESDHYVVIYFIPNNSQSFWQMDIKIPYELWKDSQYIDFNKCISESNCQAYLVEDEGIVNGPAIEEHFIKALNIVEDEEKSNNFVDIEKASTNIGAECHGSLELFFAEYYADVDSIL